MSEADNERADTNRSDRVPTLPIKHDQAGRHLSCSGYLDGLFLHDLLLCVAFDGTGGKQGSEQISARISAQPGGASKTSRGTCHPAATTAGRRIIAQTRSLGTARLLKWLAFCVQNGTKIRTATGVAELATAVCPGPANMTVTREPAETVMIKMVRVGGAFFSLMRGFEFCQRGFELPLQTRL